MPRRGPLLVYLAALVALAGIPIHLYWALGGTWALPGGAATASLSGLRATNAIGSVVSVSHGLFGLVTKSLYLAGAHSAVSWPEPLTAAQKNHATLLDLGVFEPWFLIQGLLLLFAGRWFARTVAGRRRWWTLSLIAGVVLVDAFGVTLAVAHRHFAVS